MIRIIGALLFAVVAFGRDAHAQFNCTNSPQDETIIEYFNEIDFEDLIEIIVTDTGKAYGVTLSCPARVNADFPPSDFDLMMTTAANTMPISCDGGSETFNYVPSPPTASELPSCNWPNCNFFITLKNKTTGTVYSQTETQITFPGGNSTFLPELNPATLPICNNTINGCIVDGTCSLSTEKLGNLTLCESSTSCLPPPNNNGYGYNENNYYQPS